MTKIEGEIPYFIEMKGCINCPVQASFREKTGHDYGFDHEYMAGCILMGCVGYGHNLMTPYFHPLEIVRLANENGSPGALDIAKRVCLMLQDRYGEFYKAVGLDMDEVLETLNKPL